jgi:hypothetical protein
VDVTGFGLQLGFGLGRKRRRGVASSAPVVSPSAGFAGGYAAAGTIAPPALDTSLQGSGFARKPIAGLKCAPFRRFTNPAGEMLAVMAVTLDPAFGGIAAVNVYLEGGAITLTSPVKIGSDLGYLFKVSSGAADGVANLVIDVVPVNGYVLRMTRPIILDSNGTLAASRPVRYVNSATGNNANNGLTPGTAWANITYAAANAQNDMDVQIEGGTQNEDHTPISEVTTLLAPITFRQRPGSAGRVTVTRTGARANLFIRCNNAKFQGIDFDSNKISTFGNTLLTAVQSHDQGLYTSMLFEDCVVADSATSGVRIGPSDLHQASTIGHFLPTTEGRRLSFVRGSVSGAYTSVATFYCEDTEFFIGGDCGGWTHTAPWMTDLSFFNRKVSWMENVKQRLHVPATLTVASAAYGAPNTTITLSGAPSITTQTGSADYKVEFLTGALAGNIYNLVSQNDGTDTVLIATDLTASIAPGDTLRTWVSAHSDANQIGDPNGSERSTPCRARNIFIYGDNLKTLPGGSAFQPLFLASKGLVGRGTLSATGTAVTISGITCAITSSAQASGRTTLNFNTGPAVDTIGAQDRNRTQIQFLTGALAGNSYTIYSQNSTSTIVQGLISPANGDTFAAWPCADEDFIQITQTGHASRYQWRKVTARESPVAMTIDAAFSSAVSGVTVWATAKSQHDMAYINLRSHDAGNQSQQIGGFVNCAISQSSHAGTLLLRTASAVTQGQGYDDAMLTNNYFGVLSQDAGPTFPPSTEMIFDNNTQSSGTLYGTNNEINAGVTFDAEMRPTGLSKTMSNPLWPWDALGNAVSGASLIGAAH